MLQILLLTHDIGEGMKVVEFLLQLSKDMIVCEQIGKVQGCILIVTMSNRQFELGKDDEAMKFGWGK